MPVTTKMKIKGLRHVERVLQKELPVRVQARVIERTMRKASLPMRRVAKRKARVAKERQSGALSLSISTWKVAKGLLRQSRIRGLKTAARLHLGPRRNFKRAFNIYAQHYFNGRVSPTRYVNGIRHGHLIEWGHKQSGRKGKKKVEAFPFMEPAFRQEGTATIERFRKIIWQELRAEVQKLAARQKVRR